MKPVDDYIKIIENNIKDPAFIIDSDFVVVKGNNAAKVVFGLMRDGSEFLTGLHEKYGVVVAPLQSELTSQGEVFAYPVSIETDKGERKQFLLYINVLSNTEGKLFLATFNSISFRKGKDEEKKKYSVGIEPEDFLPSDEVLKVLHRIKEDYPFTFISKQRIHKEIDKFDYSFFVKESSGKYVLANKRFCELVGTKRSGIIGQYDKNIHSFEEYLFIRKSDDFLVQSGKTLVANLFGEKDIILPLFNDSGETVAIVGYGTEPDEAPKISRNSFVLNEVIYDLNEKLIIMDENLNLLSYSKDTEGLFGFTKENIEKSVETLLPRELTEGIVELLKSNKEEEKELSLAINDNEFDITVETKDNPFGTIITAKFYEINIENREIEAKAKMYDIIMHTSPEAIFIYDVDNLRFLDVNDAALNLYGYRRDEFLEMDLTDLYAPEDIQTLIESSSAKSLPNTFTGPWRHKHKTGKSLFVELFKTTIEYKGSKAHVNIIRDIGKSIEDKKKLKEYKLAFEYTGDIIIVTDADGFITYANSSCAEKLNYSLEELDNKPFLSLVGDGERGKINQKLFLPKTKDRSEFQTKLKNSKNELIEVYLIAEAILDYQDEVERYSILMRPERKVEIVEKPKVREVEETKGKALDANFLSNLFHELLTPVNVIIGFGQEIAESIENPNEEQQEAVQIIKENQRSLLQLMDTAAEYVHFEQNEVELEPEDLLFVDLIDRIEEDTKKTAEAFGVKFSYGKISSSLRLESDKNRLLSLISLFVSFGIRSTKEEAIYLSAYQIDQDRCAISLRDGRTKISDKALENLEKIFSQDESEVKRQFGISRFTLRLARKLIEVLADGVEVLERNGEPVEYAIIVPKKFKDIFTTPLPMPKVREAKPLPEAPKEMVEAKPVIIPEHEEEKEQPLRKVQVVQPQQPQEVVEVREEQKPEEKATDVAGGQSINVSVNVQSPHTIEQNEAEEPPKVVPTEPTKILASPEGINFKELNCIYLEDQVDSQILFKVQMKELKSVEFAPSFEKALPLLRAKYFDFIVMDINLQGEYNGLDALRAIRQMAGYDSIPIIAVTAYVLPGDREKFIAAGFSDFITKPILREKLDEVLKGLF